MKNQTHFFYAIKIPDETKELLNLQCQKLKEHVIFKRWVHPQDLHITLAFLGHAPMDQLESSKKKVLDALSGSNEVSIEITKLGTFGSKESPRIFWAGMKENTELNQIRNQVFSACEKAGFQLESRPFKPHITLARKWAGEQPFRETLLDAWYSLQPIPIQFTATEVVLYETHMENTPKYEIKEVFPL